VAALGAARALRVYAIRSDTDPLTGLLNRRAFVETVTRRLAGRGSGRTYATVVMVDLDDFKRINDTHGHATGDRVLLEVAELLRRHNPPGGAVCRAGGEEFLLAILGERAAAQATVRRLCDAIAALPHDVTASIGTKSVSSDTVSGSASEALVEELIAAADHAMYLAKRNGGNRVQHAQDEVR
jgi:diguanylate cyclase (GGDEF)-like protein